METVVILLLAPSGAPGRLASCRDCGPCAESEEAERVFGGCLGDPLGGRSPQLCDLRHPLPDVGGVVPLAAGGRRRATSWRRWFLGYVTEQWSEMRKLNST